MQNLNDLIKDKQNYEHSLKFLQNLIISIEEYPELRKTKLNTVIEDKDLTTTKKNTIILNKVINQTRDKINDSNLKEIKELLTEIENLLKQITNKSNDNNINIRINYLNIKELAKIYNREQKLKQIQLQNLKKQLKHELEELDKSLSIYGKISKNQTGYIIEKNIYTTTNLSQVWGKISIKHIINDLYLENYEQEYYKQLPSNKIDNTFYKLYPNSNLQRTNLIKKLFPDIQIAELLEKITKNNNKELISQCYLTGDLILKIEQLKNLKTQLIDQEYSTTIQYIDNIIEELESLLSIKETNIKRQLRIQISKLNIKESLIKKDNQIQELIKLILKITENEIDQKLIPKYNKTYYKELLKEDLKKYQQIRLNQYEINININELLQLISNSQPEENKNNPKKKNSKSLLKKISKKLKQKQKK